MSMRPVCWWPPVHWVHVASNALFTALFCHRKSGTEAIDADGVLPGFTGIAVHDTFTSYAASGGHPCLVQRPSAARGHLGLCQRFWTGPRVDHAAAVAAVR